MCHQNSSEHPVRLKIIFAVITTFYYTKMQYRLSWKILNSIHTFVTIFKLFSEFLFEKSIKPKSVCVGQHTRTLLIVGTSCREP